MSKPIEIEVSDVGQVSKTTITEFSWLYVTIGGQTCHVSGEIKRDRVHLDGGSEGWIKQILRSLGKGACQFDAELERVKKAIYQDVQNRLAQKV